jgi:peptide deformylase
MNDIGKPERVSQKRIFVMETGSGLEIVINPILTPGRGIVGGQEGCLSVPGLKAYVARHEQVSRSEPPNERHIFASKL